MSDSMLDPLHQHHPVPQLPPPGPPRTPSAATATVPCKDVCERLPAHLRPGCKLNDWLGFNPRPQCARPARPALDDAARAARAAMPGRAHESALIKKLDHKAHDLELAHLALEALESGHLLGLKVPNPGVATAGVGVAAGLGLFVKVNIEQARANRDGILAARAHAVARGFAFVLAATIDQGKLTELQRRPELWPVPSTIPNRCDEDYRAGVRAALSFLSRLTPGQLGQIRRDLEQATATVTRQPGDTDARCLEKRAAVLLGGYDTRPDLRF
ncbi:MAG TPA: hypothetical protein VGQ83_14890 [Polyangia bacterium]|jgi:hypothetical protein